MNLNKAIENALNGEAILFVGSGFSQDAININDGKFKLGGELAKYLSSEIGIESSSSLEDAAEVYAEKNGTDKLIEVIQKEYTAKTIQPFHQNIATIPWKRIYTTNYDNIIETAYHATGNRLTPITLSHDLYRIPKDHTICIHLNGFVESLDREKIWNELKLTESSYVTASIVDSPWAMLLRQDIRLAQSVFFIGYSLFDLDIKRILAESESLKEKCFFFLGESTNEATIRRVKKFGTVILKTAKEFIEIKKEIEKTFTPKDKTEISLRSVNEFFYSTVATAITDKTFIDLLLFGKRTNEIISESFRTGKTFYLFRKETNSIVDKIASGQRYFVINSDLCNGKSMLLEGLKLKLAEQGFRIFEALERNEHSEKEFEFIAKLNDRIVLIVEEYQNWLDEISVFSSNASDTAIIICTARNAVNDIMIDDLHASLGRPEILEINVDLLGDDEISWIITALDEYGLWGKRAGQGIFEKRRFLTSNCRRQFHAILLKLLESPQIAKKLTLISHRLKDKGENYKILLSILILSLLNHGPTLDILTDIWGTDAIYNPNFKSDPLIKEVISFNYYAALVRSPIAAQYLIQNTVEGETISAILIRMVEKIIAGSKISPRYRDIFKSLTRFSSVQSLFPEKRGKRKAILHYYESIKNYDNCHSNPLFWLQYAIASLVQNEIFQSKKYFETSYSLARKRGWDTFQIDNHYARFLMVEATQVLDYPEIMNSFREARNIINRQIQDDRRHYPYRVATNYQNFIDRFGKKLKKGEIKEVQDAALNVLDKIDTLPAYRKSHRYVSNCKTALEHVVLRCDQLLA